MFFKMLESKVLGYGLQNGFMVNRPEAPQAFFIFTEVGRMIACILCRLMKNSSMTGVLFKFFCVSGSIIVVVNQTMNGIQL
ncbi:MAG: hypothetical protein RL161_974 [Bacteroidota bacterium]